MRVLSIAVVCALVACHKPAGSGVNGPISSTWSGPPLLAYVPADTPYLMAVLQPPPPAVRQRMLDQFATAAREAVAKLDALRSADRSTLDPWLRAALALRDELHGDDPATWATDLGFDPGGRILVYGYGLWPVARVDLLDPAKLSAAATRIAAAAGPAVKSQAFEGRAYWAVALDDVTVVAAVVDRHAMIALVPTASVSAALPHLLGTHMPEASLRTAQVLPALVARHGFGPSLVGYLDAQRIVEDLEQGGPLHDPVTTKLGADLTGACRTDVERLVAVAPRLAFGYTRLDDRGMDARFVVETPAWLSSQLAQLRAEVPPTPTDGVAMLAMGAAVDFDKLEAWLGGVAGQLHAHPFTCPAFSDLDEAVGQLGTSLAHPMPPMMHGLRGASLVIDDASLSPPGGTGHLALFGDHVGQLVSLAGAFLPWIAALHVTPDGTPVELPLAQLGVPGLSAHIGMHPDRLVIAIGDASAQRVTDQLAAPAHGKSPLLTFAYDPKRLADRLGPVLHDAKDLGEGSFASIALVLDAAGDGLSLDVSGTWAPPPAAALAH